MRTKVYNNVVDHRVLDGGVICEDVTSITLPTIEHPTTSIENVAGMTANIDMPNPTHVNAMEFGIAHNNGANCSKLQTPGKHSIETRIARQVYDVAGAEIGYESVKIRVIGAHKSTEKGNVEMGNPLGSTDKYSVIRYEEIVDGNTTVLIDATANKLTINGQDFVSDVESLLN